MDAIIVNCWRGVRDTTIIYPWVTSFEHDNNGPSTMKEVRKEFSNEGPIDDFVGTFAVNYLRELQVRRFGSTMKAATTSTQIFNTKEREILEIVSFYKLR